MRDRERIEHALDPVHPLQCRTFRNAAARAWVAAAHQRWRIERDDKDLRQDFGLGHYEGRDRRGFHRHAALCIAAYGFLMAERLMPTNPSAARKPSPHARCLPFPLIASAAAVLRPQRHAANSIPTLRQPLAYELIAASATCLFAYAFRCGDPLVGASASLPTRRCQGNARKRSFIDAFDGRDHHFATDADGSHSRPRRPASLGEARHEDDGRNGRSDVPVTGHRLAHRDAASWGERSRSARRARDPMQHLATAEPKDSICARRSAAQRFHPLTHESIDFLAANRRAGLQ